MGGLHRRGQREEGKKLTEAARHWAIGPQGPDEETISDLDLFGAGAELVEQLRRRKEEAARFEVHEDEWPTVELFLACDTQWRTADGLPVGLDFAAVEVVARVFGRPLDRELFGDLKTMERAALQAAAEVRKKT